MKSRPPSLLQAAVRALSRVALPFWLGACVLLGGASNAGIIGNGILQLLAVAVIAGSTWKGWGPPLGHAERSLFFIAALFALWVVVTLVPVPPGLWGMLPGRGNLLAGYGLLGMEAPWLAISLDPQRTLRSLLALLVPMATWLLARRQEDSRAADIPRYIALLGGLSAILGFVQIASGRTSRLRLYDITNSDQLVGFFANANHFSTFMVVCLPLAAAAIAAPAVVQPRKKKKTDNASWNPWRIVAMGCAALCASAVVLNGSKAGWVLLIPAAVSFFVVLPPRSGDARAGGGLLLAGLGIASALVLASTIGTGALQDRVGGSAASRAEFAATSLKAAREFAPAGTGGGTFSAVYAMKTNREAPGNEWVNHAHNDWVEFALEYGLPGVFLAASLLFWLLRRTLAAWRIRGADRLSRTVAASAVTAWLILAHSLVDYPLRTAALAAVMALAVTMLARDRDALFERTPT